MLCERCKKDVPEVEIMDYQGRPICEDCVMTLMSPSQACDPWAVKCATGSLSSKEDSVDALHGHEKALYGLVMERGRIPREEAPSLLNLTEDEVKRAMTTLRHMELLRGEKRDDGGADILPFDK